MPSRRCPSGSMLSSWVRTGVCKCAFFFTIFLTSTQRHLQLGKLIALYDDNHITIDGDTAVSFTEDVLKRFEAYGWHTQKLDDGDHDLADIEKAIENAKAVTDKPSIIKIRTTIGEFFPDQRVCALAMMSC